MPRALGGTRGSGPAPHGMRMVQSGPQPHPKSCHRPGQRDGTAPAGHRPAPSSPPSPRTCRAKGEWQGQVWGAASFPGSPEVLWTRPQGSLWPGSCHGPVCAAPRRAGQMLPRTGEGERRLGAPFHSLWCPPASHLFLHQPRPSTGFSTGPIHHSSLRAAGCTDSLFKNDLVNKQLKKCKPHK